MNPLVFDSGLAIGEKHALPGLPTIDPNAGATTQALGRLSAEYWLHGAVPWWNPYGGAGLPLAAEMQSSSLFLPFVLLLHFSSGVILLKILLQAIAGAATYALLRQLGLNRLAAFAGGALFEFNGTFTWFQHASIFPVPFLPVLLWGVERAFVFAGSRRRGGWVLITAAIAFSLYSGFPETAYLDGLFALLWAVLRMAHLRRDNRLVFAGKVITGGVIGVLLAAPALLPFFEFLKLSAVSHAGFGQRALPQSGFALLVMPYIYGPIEAFAEVDSTQQILIIWGNIGGYVQAAMLFLASLALLRRKKEKSLRFALAIWMAVFAIRTVSVSGIAKLTSLIPGNDLLATFRFGTPSVEMAGAVLAALAIDDWLRHGKYSRTQVAIVFAVTAAVSAVAFGLAQPILHEFLHEGQYIHAYKQWLGWWLLETAMVLLTLAALCAARSSFKRTALLVTVLAADAAALSASPLLAGLRHVTVYSGSIEFLRQHLGLQRFYSMGSIKANYSAYFQVASINHTYLPIADDWTRYIQSSLDGAVDPVNFLGDYPPPLKDREEALRSHLPAFEATAVKYVVTGAGSNPFFHRVAFPHSTAPNTPQALQKGERLSGALSSSLVETGSVLGIDVTIGTYGNATGFLQAQLCGKSECASGQAPLNNALNNLPLAIRFSRALPVTAGETLQYTFTHTDGNRPVAVWTWPTPDAQSGTVAVPGNPQLHAKPELSLIYPFGSVTPQLVYHDQIINIFELPNPAPYFDVSGGPCQLSQESRESLHASCRADAVLIRRELMYPGWRAFSNGAETSLERSASIFQTLHLSKGESDVVFRYEPSHIRWAYALALSGLLWLGIGLRGSRSLTAA